MSGNTFLLAFPITLRNMKVLEMGRARSYISEFGGILVHEQK
jgi:hypothetical protein